MKRKADVNGNVLTIIKERISKFKYIKIKLEKKMNIFSLKNRIKPHAAAENAAKINYIIITNLLGGIKESN